MTRPTARFLDGWPALVPLANRVPLGVGIERAWITFTAPAGCTEVRVYPLRGVSAGNMSGTALISACQVEGGAMPSTYVETTGAPASRAPETLQIPTTGWAWPGGSFPAAVTVHLEALATYGNDNSATQVESLSWVDTVVDRIVTRISTQRTRTTGKLTNVVEQLDVLVRTSGAVGTYPPGVRVPILSAVRAAGGVDGVRSYSNGLADVTTGTITAAPDLTDTPIVLGTIFEGVFARVQVWATGLDDADLASLTGQATILPIVPGINRPGQLPEGELGPDAPTAEQLPRMFPDARQRGRRSGP